MFILMYKVLAVLSRTSTMLRMHCENDAMSADGTVDHRRFYEFL